MDQKKDIEKTYQREDIAKVFDGDRKKYLFQRYKHKIEANFIKKTIKAFPKEVQKNINPYLILSEIELVLKKGKPTQEAIKKIKTYF